MYIHHKHPQYTEKLPLFDFGKIQMKKPIRKEEKTFLTHPYIKVIKYNNT